jgi:hypothetical protein
MSELIKTSEEEEVIDELTIDQMPLEWWQIETVFGRLSRFGEEMLKDF